MENIICPSCKLKIEVKMVDMIAVDDNGEDTDHVTDGVLVLSCPNCGWFTVLDENVKES